jgi:dihydrodipicolinate synthase/N-acetylneuraminate lyase
MDTTPVTPEKIRGSVIAVPPLARHADLKLNREANATLVRHIEAGGVTTLLYGGNANFYNVPLGEYDALLGMLTELAGENTWVIPSAGPAYGALMDQARILRQHAFSTAMVLPPAAAFTPQGVELGFRRFVEAYGKPAVLYIKSDGVLAVDQVRSLFDDGLISLVKYAIVRDNPAQDDYLRALVEAVDPRFVVSGIGEQPALVHLRDFHLGGFTSGCVCVAPRLSISTLAAIQSEQFDEAERLLRIFRPLEDLRNAIHPIRVLHDAVTLAGIVDLGPILPLLDNLAGEHRTAVAAAAGKLLAQNAG